MKEASVVLVTCGVRGLKRVPIKTLEGSGPPCERGQHGLRHEDSGLYMVQAGSVDEKEPCLEATHMEMCMRCHTGACSHVAEETVSGGPWHWACNADP